MRVTRLGGNAAKGVTRQPHGKPEFIFACALEGNDVDVSRMDIPCQPAISSLENLWGLIVSKVEISGETRMEKDGG